MALYTAESRDRVRDAVDFVELVSARTELRRAGVNRYEGLCPFHDERTPSFGIDPVQKVYYCFGCQAAGDVFTFVRETEGLDFRGALELLAERTGVQLVREAEDPREAEQRKRRERLLSLLDRTAAYYERVLWQSSEAAPAREYLLGRGLSEQALRDYRVGYAPSAWDRVLLASRRGGFSERELLHCGLAQRSRESGRPYDRFRRRVMFPLADIRGKVLGFGARALGETTEGGGRGPKYLNTSDNEIYHKGMHLYGAHLARASAAKSGSVILCEGYTDVIALHGAGMHAVVGLMGTALTEHQVAELGRMASVVLLALDADTAGQEAMLKAAKLAAARRLELRVVTLPGGMDPAELIEREGPEAMRAAVDASVPFVRFRVQQALDAGDEESPEGRDRIIEQLRPIFATIPPSALRLDLAQMVSGRLALPESLLEGLLSAAQAPRADAASAPARASGGQRAAEGREAPSSATAEGRLTAGSVSARSAQAERAFLAFCIALRKAGAEALAKVEPSAHFTDGVLRRAAEHLKAGGLEQPLAGVSESDAQLKRLLAQLVVEAGRASVSEAMLEVSSLQLELALLERRIQAAKAQAEGEVSELASERLAVKRKLDAAQERALTQSGV